MKCTYHPEKAASDVCGMCRKPLCEECREQTLDGKVLCSQCVALSAAHKAAQDEIERQLNKEEKKGSAAKKGKKSHVVMAVIIILAVIVLLANVYMYVGQKTSEVAQFDPYKYPLLTADLIDEGIEDYAKDHEGKFPDGLERLLGKYIPYEKITPSVLEMFSYKRPSPESYELRFKDPKNQELSDIVFGREVE